MMTPGMLRALSKIEDGSGWEGVVHERTEPELRIQLSQAISLKRIADALESVIDHRFDEPAIRNRGDA